MNGLRKGLESLSFALELDARRYLSVGTSYRLQFHCAQQGAISIRERLSINRKVLQQRHDHT